MITNNRESVHQIPCLYMGWDILPLINVPDSHISFNYSGTYDMEIFHIKVISFFSKFLEPTVKLDDIVASGYNKEYINLIMNFVNKSLDTSTKPNIGWVYVQ